MHVLELYLCINKDDEDWLWEDEELCEEDYEFQVALCKWRIYF